MFMSTSSLAHAATPIAAATTPAMRAKPRKTTPPPPPIADCDVETQTCDSEIVDPGAPGNTTGPGGGGGGDGSKAQPCHNSATDKPVACSTQWGSWSNGRQCY